MKRAIIMAAGALALTGCGTPDCGSEEALGLVTEIFYDNTAKRFAEAGRTNVTRSKLVEAMQVTPTMVRMTDYNETTDTYTCDATLSGRRIDLETLETGTAGYERQITFTISPSAQGGDFIVEVGGL